MESLFFNTPTQRYQIKKISTGVTKVDISNGIFFYDISLTEYTHTIKLKNLDRMVMITVIKSGTLSIKNHIDNQEYTSQENSTVIYCSSRQDFTLSAKGDIFILFVADFFLRHYLSFDKYDPIDFLYEQIQDEIVLKQISTQLIDALSLYTINKIIHTKDDKNMRSMRCMRRVMEFITHQISLIDMVNESIDKEELKLASRAKRQLLNSFENPPTIKSLAHLCATNESKLKKVFKKVHNSTIYLYIKKLRLEEANLLLREERMTIGEIALKVGYRHQGHFSKLFFETYGVYPKDLLKY